MEIIPDIHHMEQQPETLPKSLSIFTLLYKHFFTIQLNTNIKPEWKSKTRATSYELRVQIHELRVQIPGLRVQIHELRVRIQELRVQIHELED